MKISPLGSCLAVLVVFGLSPVLVAQDLSRRSQFDPLLDTIPVRFLGNNPDAVYLGLRTLEWPEMKKDEFETTPEFEARIRKAERELPIVDGLTASDVFSVVLDEYSVRYNADAGGFLFSLEDGIMNREIAQRWDGKINMRKPYVIELSYESEQVGTDRYILTSILIPVFLEESNEVLCCSELLKRHPIYPRENFLSLVHMTSPGVLLPMPRDKARVIADDLRILIGYKVKARKPDPNTFSMSAFEYTHQTVRDFETNEFGYTNKSITYWISADVTHVILFNYSTGEIYETLRTKAGREVELSKKNK